MIARSLAAHSARAVQEALLRHGWDAMRAASAAGSVQPVAILLEQVPDDAIEALVIHNRKLGIDLLTGEGWVLLAGSRSRLAAFARPWVFPPHLVGLAQEVGLALPAERAETWVTARGAIALDHPILLGVLNVTPDSFSDGGRFLTVDAALEQADSLLAAGADLVDLGAESTRPEATPVDGEEESRRLLPVLSALVQRHPSLLVSVDTVKASVAQAALAAGAAVVNDVSGLRLDPDMGRTLAEAGAGAILMHSRGGPGGLATEGAGSYGQGVVNTVTRELRASVEVALTAGIAAERQVVDPGLGFGKTAEESLALLDGLGALGSLGRPVLVGPSRKRFLGTATGRPVEDRDRATAIACVMAFERGAQLFRVHEVRGVREALQLAVAVRQM